MGASYKLATALAERLAERFMGEFGSARFGKTPAQPEPARSRRTPEYVAWIDERGKSELKRYEGSRTKLEAQFDLQKTRFDIFVNCSEKVIRTSGSKEPIPLEPRIQLMLVLFLLRRGQQIAPSAMARFAWPRGSPICGADAKRVQSNLKLAVHDLKTKLTAVKNIEIPEKRRDEGYSCQGEFTFCVLLPGELDEKLARLRLRPRF